MKYCYSEEQRLNRPERPTISDVSPWRGGVLTEQDDVRKARTPPQPPIPKGFLEEPEPGDLNKLTQGCRTVAQVSIRGIRVILSRRVKCACTGPQWWEHQESMLKKEDPSGEVHSNGVTLWGGRVSPLFPPYLEAGLILLDQLNPQTRKRRWMYWEGCSVGLLEPALFICPGLWERGLVAWTLALI